MIRLVLIDDERPAIKGMIALLSAHKCVHIVSTYTNPIKALDDLKDTNPDVVFLDISMPQIQGIDLANKIKKHNSDIHIVFVTAYNEYAVEAFEVHALDYLLKPVSSNRLKKTIKRIQYNVKSKMIQKAQLNIICLDRFNVFFQGRQPIKWRTEKIKELFLFMLYNQGKEITKHQIIEAIWPDYDIKRAVHYMYNGIYYIKKVLSEYGITEDMISISGRYCLNIGEVYFDLDVFNKLYSEIDKLNIDSLEYMVDIFQANHVKEEDYEWGRLISDDLETKLHDIKMRLVHEYMKDGRYINAERLIEIMLNENPYDEGIIIKYLEYCKLTHKKTIATRAYMSYTDVLKEELQIKPSQKVTSIYKEIV